MATEGSGRGTSLLEVLVVLTLIAVAAHLTAPTLVRWRQRQELEAAIRSLALDFARACAQAVASGRSHGLLLASAKGELSWQLVADGDGDGILSADLAAGTDLRLGPTRLLSRYHPGVRPDRPAAVPPLPNGAAGSGGLAFGRSPIVSCSAAGAARSGSLYLRSTRGDAAALRVFGSTARVSLWWWDPASRSWLALG